MQAHTSANIAKHEWPSIADTLTKKPRESWADLTENAATLERCVVNHNSADDFTKFLATDECSAHVPILPDTTFECGDEPITVQLRGLLATLQSAPPVPGCQVGPGVGHPDPALAVAGAAECSEQKGTTMFR